MRYRTAVLLLIAAAGISGCSDSSGPDSYENIAGSYAGNMSGLSQGVRLDGTFSVTLSQNGGSVGGIWGLQGVLDNGTTTIPVAGNGPVTGSLAEGENPSVTLVIRTNACPNYQATFAGSFDSAARRLTLSGPVEFLGANCSVVLSYQSTFVLTR